MSEVQEPETKEAPLAATSDASTNGSSTETIDQTGASVNANLEAALSYLRRGWSCFPLVPRTKRPAVTLEPFLSGERRMTEDDARGYWSAHPDAGVAIVMGAPSGLICLDVDPRNGGDPEKVSRDCPTNLIARTGRGDGGLHLFVRHPGGRIPKGKTDRPGVDRQSDGSYIVAAPTLHEKTGEPYRWLNEGEPGELPAWAKESPAAAASDGGVREPWIAETLAHPENAAPGTQEETLTKLCWWVAGHLDRDIAFSIVWPWLSRVPLGDPNNPWMPEHVGEKLDRAYEKRAKDAEKPPADKVAEAVLFPIRTMDELARDVMSRQEEPWLCEGWVPARGPFMVAGPSHVGKTWLMLDLAMSVAMGRPFLGTFPVEQGPVLFVAGEDDDRMLLTRLYEIHAAKLRPEDYDEAMRRALAAIPAAERENVIPVPDFPLENLRLHTEGGFRFGDDAREAALFKAAKSIKPRLIVLDPFKDMVSAKELTDFMAGCVHHMQFVHRLRNELGCAIGVVHHTGKNEERALTSAGIQGNSMFVASFDTRWIIAKAGERAGVINRETKASAPLPFVSYTFEVGEGGFKVETKDVSEHEARDLIRRAPGRTRTDAGAEDAAILAVVRERQPISARKVSTALTARGIDLKKDALIARLHRLAESGAVKETPKGWVSV